MYMHNYHQINDLYSKVGIAQSVEPHWLRISKLLWTRNDMRCTLSPMSNRDYLPWNGNKTFLLSAGLLSCIAFTECEENKDQQPKSMDGCASLFFASRFIETRLYCHLVQKRSQQRVSSLTTIISTTLLSSLLK